MTYRPQSTVDFDPSYLSGGNRLQISQQIQLFEGRNGYNLSPILFETASNVNGTVSHLPNESGVSLSIPTASGDKIVRQTYEYFTYVPSKPVKFEFAFAPPTAKANLRIRLGAFDDENGFFFERVNTTNRLVRRTYVSGSAVDNQVNQSSWNVDKLDGTGASGITIDFTKIQMMFIEYMWYGAGTIRIGFEIDGESIIAHEFYIANTIATPSATTGTLPMRFEIENTGTTSGSSALKTYGASVVSEGGSAESRGYLFSAEGTVTAGSATRTHIISVRPKTTFNSITNRVRFDLESIDLLVTGANPILWEVVYGQALTTPTYADVNATYSAFEFATAETLSGSPAVVANSGYCSASNQVKGQARPNTTNVLPVTLDAAGAVRDLGTITVLVTGIGGTSETRCIMNWREIS